MEMVQRKFANLIAYQSGKDLMVLNGDGLCVACTNQKKIGSTINVHSKSLESASIKVDHGGKSVLFFKKELYSERELELIRNLAKITLEHYINKVSQPSGSIDQFITKVIEKPIDTENSSGFESEAESFGIDLSLPRVAILVELKDFTEENLINSTSTNYTHEDIIQDWKNKIASSITGFFTIKTDIVSAYIGRDRFVFFKELSGNEERFIKLMKEAFSSIFAPLITPGKDNLSVGFSNSYTGVDGLHESYHEAIQALNLGKKFIKNKNQGYFYGDLGTLRIITEQDIEKKKTFATEVLEPLEKETLRETLETFLNENMDIKKTAHKLKIHPNTVNYRLTKIAEHLGLDPRIFKQAFELRIALLTDKIFD